MYPFSSPLKWWVNNRWLHLLAVLEGQDSIYKGKWGRLLERRAMRIRRWLKVRLGLLAMLSFSVIAAAIALAVAFLQQQTEDAAVGEAAAGVATLAESIARIAASGAGLFTLLWILTNRTLGQLEVNILAILATHPDLSKRGMKSHDSRNVDE